MLWESILTILFNPSYLGLNVLGVVIGIIVGAIPGLTATLTIALLIPFAFGRATIPSFALMIGIYVGGIYGGGITATAIGTPGTPGAMATVFDGYAMTKKGLAGKALGMGLYASVLGGFIGCIILATVAPPVARFSLKFSEPEFFMLAVFGLSVILAISSESIIKGLVSGSIGAFAMTVGLDPIVQYPRFTFGNIWMLRGVPMISAFIGVFALSRLLLMIENKPSRRKMSTTATSSSSNLTLKEFKDNLYLMIKSSFIGTLVGTLPGAGANIASVVALTVVKQSSKHPEKFGTGILEGIAAPESANNAVTGGALIPMLTLGIPGDAITAVLMGALMIQGLRPGPLLFKEQPQIVYSLIASMVIAYFVLAIVGTVLLKYFVKLSAVRVEIIMPVVGVFALMGSFVLESFYYYMYVTLAFGVISWLLQHFKYPIAPLGLVIILGPIAELSFRRAMMGHRGDLTIFVTRPISLVLLILVLLSIGYGLYQAYFANKKKAEVLN